MDLGLTGRTAFVTGGTHGIGLAIAHALISEGVKVTVCGRTPDRLHTALAALGPDARGVTADVLDPDALAAAVHHAATPWPDGGPEGLDLVVANAGGSAGRDLLDSTPQEWAETLALNVGHAAHTLRVATPHLARSDAASALIIASISGRKPGTRSSYSVAKAAEIHLATVLAEELARHRIRVNSLSPGSVYFEGGRWGNTHRDHPERFAAFTAANLPAGRLVTLAEVADTACFLLSPRASGVNGADVPVDGAQDRSTDRRFY
ncbi:SDR family NAD(P)-dependent oxidoreductase [Actinocorallia lasiicapitis]